MMVLLILISLKGYAQEPVKHRLIPLDMESIRYKDTYIKITYSRPHKNGRKIFGGLVPYEEVWNPGANETTEIMLNRPILVNGDTLESGAYSMFTIPGKEKWTVIFNGAVGLWGSYRYNEKFDSLRVEIPARETNVAYEPLTIEFEKNGMKKTNLNLIWDRTLISIPIEFLEEKEK